MYFMSPASNITPASVSVAMSRSDSRDSHYSSTSSTSSSSRFTSAPMTVSYSTSPSSYRLNRTISSSSSSTSTSPRSSESLSRRDSSSYRLGSPYRSCQVQGYEEPSSYLSDDDLLYIAPITAQPKELPIETIPGPEALLRKKELTTEEQIAMLREMQEKEQQDQMMFQHQRRQSAQKAVRFAEAKPRRSSQPKRRGPVVRKGLSQLNGPQ